MPNRKKKKTLGQEIIEGLRELCRAVKAREPLRKRFTVRTARKPAPRDKSTAAAKGTVR